MTVPTPAPRPLQDYRVDGTDALLTAVAAGDLRAYETLYRRVSGPVYGLALRVLRDPEHADEVAQEALLQVWREARRFEVAQGSAMAWVMTIAHRRAVDRLRSEGSGIRRHERAAVRDVETAYDTVAEAVETRLDRAAVRECLAVLTEPEREAVDLTYYSGHTYREVAELIDVPLSTVKTRIRDGMIRMRDCIGVVLAV